MRHASLAPGYGADAQRRADGSGTSQALESSLRLKYPGRPPGRASTVRVNALPAYRTAALSAQDLRTENPR